MDAVRTVVKRNEMVVFVLLAYLFSWWTVPFTGGSLLPQGPLFAALVVVGLSAGRAGIRAWWNRQRQYRVAWHWYAIAAAFPLVIPLLAAGLNLLPGAQQPSQINWLAPLQTLPVFLLLGGQWEEPGWTGYALPRLFERLGPTTSAWLTATGIVALMRAGWHLPLIFYGHIPWSDLLLSFSLQVVIAWLFTATAISGARMGGSALDRTNGSVLAVMLLHLLNNVIAGGFVHPWFMGADSVRFAWLQALLWTVAAAAILFVWLRGKAARMAFAAG